jgi:hypothetical protein
MKTSRFVLILAKCSLLGAGVLLAANQFVPAEVHTYLSSFPLALAGLGYTLLQIHLKPPRPALLKRLVLAAAFLLWAVVQLLSPGRLAVFLGDTVIAAYVLDLYWIMLDQGLQRLHQQDRADQDQARMNIQHELPRV